MPALGIEAPVESLIKPETRAVWANVRVCAKDPTTNTKIRIRKPQQIVRQAQGVDFSRPDNPLFIEAPGF